MTGAQIRQRSLLCSEASSKTVDKGKAGTMWRSPLLNMSVEILIQNKPFKLEFQHLLLFIKFHRVEKAGFAHYLGQPLDLSQQYHLKTCDDAGFSVSWHRINLSRDKTLIKSALTNGIKRLSRHLGFMSWILVRIL